MNYLGIKYIWFVIWWITVIAMKGIFVCYPFVLWQDDNLYKGMETSLFGCYVDVLFSWNWLNSILWLDITFPFHTSYYYCCFSCYSCCRYRLYLVVGYWTNRVLNQWDECFNINRYSTYFFLRWFFFFAKKKMGIVLWTKVSSLLLSSWKWGRII